MKLKIKPFIKLMQRFKTTIKILAFELDITPKEFCEILKGGEFDYEQSKTIIAMFGAAEMLTVIDWEGTHAADCLQAV